MRNNKIFILLPDGVGLRNFAYTAFYNKGIAKGFDITFWNQTPFDLAALGFKEIKIKDGVHSQITEILKKARVRIELDSNKKRSRDKVYDSYRFPLSYRNPKHIIKSSCVRVLSLLFWSAKGQKKLREWIFAQERRTAYYKKCIEVLKTERPAVVFCTNQRTVSSIAPLLAAQALGIPTATFIYSWDNLPKATLMLEPDYYFVWSNHMRDELLYYYSFIKPEEVIVTGTPQFEVHTYENNVDSREDFFREYGLELDRKYICYSGDDITTSPNDPQYLEDTARAVNALNSEKGQRLGIIFRRCPVDFSDRFDAVLEKYKDVVTVINPKWEAVGAGWNTVLPTKADMRLLMNTITHSELVVNLGSSMVFDYASFGKACAFINYDVENCSVANWSVKKIYNYVHFRSMPSRDSVLWINSPGEIAGVIEEGLGNKLETIGHAEEWFAKINQYPAKDASERILAGFERIIEDSEKKLK